MRADRQELILVERAGLHTLLKDYIEGQDRWTGTEKEASTLADEAIRKLVKTTNKRRTI